MDRKLVHKCAPVVGAFGLITVGLALPAQATNLLLNPSFESPTVATTESTTATGWTFYPAGEAERAQFFVHTGLWSVFQKTFDPAGGVTQVVTGIVPGSPYTLSGWEFAEANAGTTNSTLDFKLTWEDGSGSPIGTPSALFFPASSVSTSGFAQLTLTHHPALAPLIRLPGLTSDGRVFRPVLQVVSHYHLRSLPAGSELKSWSASTILPQPRRMAQIFQRSSTTSIWKASGQCRPTPGPSTAAATGTFPGIGPPEQYRTAQARKRISFQPFQRITMFLLTLPSRREFSISTIHLRM